MAKEQVAHAFRGTYAGTTFCGIKVRPNEDKTAMLSRATRKPICVTGWSAEVTCKSCWRSMD